MEERGLGPDDDPGYPREPEYLVLVRVLLAQDRPAQAVALLGRLHAAAVAQGRTGSVIEIRALQALALAAMGEENTAVDTLAQALMLGCPQGYVRVFADEGVPMSALLAGWSRRRRRTTLLPAGCRLAAWPGCCGRSANRPRRRAPGETPRRRCRVWSSS